MGCPECGSKLDRCGSAPVFDKEGNVVHNATEQMYKLFYYCRQCNANLEYTKLLSD
jgi:uncharacterized protein with PIN domain